MNQNRVSEPLLSQRSGEWDAKARPEGLRWLSLVVFSFLNFSNAVLWITFAPISSLTEDRFGITPAEVNILSIVFMIMYIPGSVLASWVFQKYGSRRGILLAGLGNVVGSFIRCLALLDSKKFGFWFLLLGQIIAASAQPFFTNFPAKLSSIWFPIEERDIATTIAVSFNPIGCAIGTVVPPILVSKNGGMTTLLLSEAILQLVLFFAAILLFAEEPRVPPSRTAFVRRESRHLSRIETGSEILHAQVIGKQIQDCLKNRNFILLALSYGMSLGILNAFFTIINQITRPAGYTDDDAGLFGFALIATGMVGAMLFGTLMNKIQRYNQLLKLGFVFTAALTLLVVLEIRPNNTTMLLICFAGAGFFSMPLSVVAFSCGVECMYPVEEEITTGILMSSGQIFGIVLTLVIGWLISIQPDYGDSYVFEKSYIVVTSISFVAAGFSLLYNGPYKRLENDAESSSTFETTSQT